MKNILCYGDSNTFGYNPLVENERYHFAERWTGVLQNLLGGQYRIIEEGCNGRTTVFEDQIQADKNGRTYLLPCLESQRPLDLVILCLGTNDLKTRFHLAVNDIARGMEVLAKMALHYDYGSYAAPNVLVMSPVHLKAGVEKRLLSGYDLESVEKSQELAHQYKKVANLCQCAFFDAASVAEAGTVDYAHMTPEGHKKLGAALSSIVKELLIVK